MIQRLQTFAWDGGYLLEGLLDAVKWPFERLVWAVERGLVWPLEDRADRWGVPARTLGAVALSLLAVAVGVFGLLWASGGSTRHVTEASSPVAAPALTPAAPTTTTPSAPVLHGAVPNFEAQPKQAADGAGNGVAKSAGAEGTAAPSETQATTETVIGSSPSASTSADPPAPAATAVAHRFAEAFVLYEIGRATPPVKATFAATATPRLEHRLLAHPPRLPANVKVPKAKVLNIVAGPRHGDVYTLSASLLRVGITSELRLTVERETDGSWLVANTLG